jgi:hypothetical protein
MPRKRSAGSNLVDLGRFAAHARARATRKPVDLAGQEAALNACGVGAAMLPGSSWTPPSSTGWW